MCILPNYIKGWICLLSNVSVNFILLVQIRILIGKRAHQDKRLQALEEDLAKSESKLAAAVREKNTLLANVASLEKQLLELRKSNDLLKTKVHIDSSLLKALEHLFWVG